MESEKAICYHCGKNYEVHHYSSDACPSNSDKGGWLDSSFELREDGKLKERISQLEAQLAAANESVKYLEQYKQWHDDDVKRVEIWSSGIRMTDEEVEPLLAWLQETGGKKSCVIALELCRARTMEETHWKSTEDYDAGLKLRRKAEQRGIERWRAERSTERELMLPDTADFITWLLHENDSLVDSLASVVPEEVRAAAERGYNRVYDQEGTYWDNESQKYHGAANDAEILAQFILSLPNQDKGGA